MSHEETDIPACEPLLGGVELFKALADPNRLVLLAHLARAGAPLNVSEASTCCGIHLSGVSRHLGILKRAGVVTAERRGREVVYSVCFERVGAALRSAADLLDRLAAASEGRPCCAPSPPPNAPEDPK